jgi:hypothetical protein
MKKYFIILAIIAVFTGLRADDTQTENIETPPPAVVDNNDVQTPQPATDNNDASAPQPAVENHDSQQNTVNDSHNPPPPPPPQPEQEQQPVATNTENTEQSPTEETQTNQATTPAHNENQEENLTPEEQKIKSLLRKNPFAEPGSVVENGTFGDTTSPATAPDGLELRGITCIDGKWKFYVYDASMKMGYRIGLRQPQTDMSPYTIDFYDEETNSVSISNSLGTYTLTLKIPDAPKGKPLGAPTATKKKAPAKVKVTRARR